METKRESEKRIREMLENFEIKPSARVWEGIVSSSPAPVAEPRNMRPFRIGAAVTVVVSALLVIWYLSVDNREVPVQVAELAVESSESMTESSEAQDDISEGKYQQGTTAPSAHEVAEVVAPPAKAPATTEDVSSVAGTAATITEKAGRSSASSGEANNKPAQMVKSAPKSVAQSDETLKPEPQQMPVVTTSVPDTPSVIITSPEKLDVFIPNAFAPNGDGVNDIFLPVIQNNAEVFDYKMQIYARSGNLLFESTSADVGWDGKYLGALVDDQVCVYLITFRDSEGNPYLKRGTVTLIK